MDECSRCGGYWFDHREAEITMGLQSEIKELQAFSIAQPQCHKCERTYPSGTGLCPTCRVPLYVSCPTCCDMMSPVRVLGVQLDLCTQCLGLWFDADELKRLHSNLKAQGVRLGGKAPFLLCSACGAADLKKEESYYSGNGLVCGPCMRSAEAQEAMQQALEQRAQQRRRAQMSYQDTFGHSSPDSFDLLDVFDLFQ